MKSKIFKIVLPVFALVFAITASLAFIPAEDSMLDDAPITSAWYHNPDEQNCIKVDVDCDVNGCEVCTVQISGLTVQVFKKDAASRCHIVLFKSAW